MLFYIPPEIAHDMCIRTGFETITGEYHTLELHFGKGQRFPSRLLMLHKDQPRPSSPRIDVSGIGDYSVEIRSCSMCKAGVEVTMFPLRRHEMTNSRFLALDVAYRSESNLMLV